MDKATIYQDRDNEFSVILKKNGVILTPEEMAGISDYEIRYKGTYYKKSDGYDNSFDVDNSTATITIKPAAFGLVASKRGDVVEFIIYDVTNYPNGLVWNQLKLVVKKDASIA